MALYQFECKKCKSEYDAFAPYDETGKYKGVSCPNCKSKSKVKLINVPKPLGTRSRMNNFGYRAGKNMEKAKGERRTAEALSHMGSTPYHAIDDTPLDTGIHDNEGPIRLSV